MLVMIGMIVALASIPVGSSECCGVDSSLAFVAKRNHHLLSVDPQLGMRFYQEHLKPAGEFLPNNYLSL